MDKQAEDLIQRKLMKIGKKSHSLTLRNRGKDELTEGLEASIKEIRKIKIEGEDQDESNKEELQYLMDQKITLLEKLLAEKNTES